MAVKFDKDGWPVEIPWPERGEWTTNRLVSADGKRCCISGWGMVALYGEPRVPEMPDAFWEREKRRRRPSYLVHVRMTKAAQARGFSGYIEFNDDETTTDADRSAVWAEVWEHFGYTEER